MKALITAEFDETQLKRLEGVVQVEYRSWRKTGTVLSERELSTLIRELNSDILIVELENVDEEVIRETNLRLIGLCRSDPQRHVDLNAASLKRVPVIYTPGRNANAVAELTLALILSLMRRVVAADRLLKAGLEIRDMKDFITTYNRLQGVELRGKTVGIIGFGRIGRLVAERMRCFPVRLLVYDPYVEDKTTEGYGCVKVELTDLLRESDIVTLHASITETSVGMIGEKEISLMKPSAYLLNLANPLLIDEDALYQALKEGRIAGAGLDVVSDQPVTSSERFLKLDNVILTPHIGGNTVETVYNHSKMIVDDVFRFLDGKKPIHLLNPEVYADE
ncbi:hypothetical protein KEJ49_07445 [Candidatus Bathyarchaeota archaeon]|nr:hypothetical protein [Candidatus Bathyarchaeota archaeon]